MIDSGTLALLLKGVNAITWQSVVMILVSFVLFYLAIVKDYEPLLLDWRAPLARAFYVATAASPENMRRRRQFHTLGRRLTEGAKQQ